ncbi:MAG: heme exporter protein CcmD [Pseudomonadota bacterium]
MTDFLAMGGHGLWVWTAYGFAAIVLIAMIVASLRHARVQAARLMQMQARRGTGTDEA